MKNINNYILTAIVSLVLVVATSFLMTALTSPSVRPVTICPWCSALWVPEPLARPGC